MQSATIIISSLVYRSYFIWLFILHLSIGAHASTESLEVLRPRGVPLTSKFDRHSPNRPQSNDILIHPPLQKSLSTILGGILLVWMAPQQSHLYKLMMTIVIVRMGAMSQVQRHAQMACLHAPTRVILKW